MTDSYEEARQRAAEHVARLVARKLRQERETRSSFAEGARVRCIDPSKLEDGGGPTGAGEAASRAPGRC